MKFTPGQKQEMKRLMEAHDIKVQINKKPEQKDDTKMNQIVHFNSISRKNKLVSVNDCLLKFGCLSKNTTKSCIGHSSNIIIANNNTSPATHKNSALREVFCFWGFKNA
jgi:hypothetical protein